MRIGSIFVVSAIALAMACGGSQSNNTPPPPAPTNDAGPSPSPTESGDDDAGVEAGLDPHDVFPASHPPIPQIHYFGGRVLKNPKLVTVTFAGMDTAVRDYVRDFDSKIGATDYWRTAMDGYGVGAATELAEVELPDTFSNNTVSDGDLKTWIATQITQKALPFPDDDTVYMLYMPSAATITLDNPPAQSCQSFGGYHFSGEVAKGGDAGTQRFIYTVLNECYAGATGVTPQDILDEETSTATHELAEAATDPDINVTGSQAGYYMTNNDAWAPDQRGGEVGDLCEGRETQIDATGEPGTKWAVQLIWNAASAKASHAYCVPSSNPVFYGAVPHTVVPGQKLGGAPLADGYVMAKKGATTDVEVDVFSTAPLTSPLTIVAGRSRYNGTAHPDPTQVSAVAKGVTMTLSQTTAQNGDKVTLHIAVDAAAASVTARFTVRAILSQTDFQSWPVILYVP